MPRLEHIVVLSVIAVAALVAVAIAEVRGVGVPRVEPARQPELGDLTETTAKKPPVSAAGAKSPFLAD